MDRDLGPVTREASPAVVIMGVPPMSKAERLYRWAASVELQRHRQAGNGARALRGGRHTKSDRSPLAIAAEDWAFQAEGLRSARWGAARAFFDLSEHEMRRILGSPTPGSRKISAAVAAERIRALAEEAEATPAPEDAGPFGRVWIGAPVRESRWLPSAAGHRRESGVPGAPF